MKTLQKVLGLSLITTGLVFGSATAMAETQKVWHDKGPIVKVHPTSKDLEVTANIVFDKEQNFNGFYSHSTFDGTVGKHGINHILHRIHLKEGGTLTFTKFEITDSEGNVLPNCDLMENPAFVEGGPSFNIHVDEEGCHIN